MNVATRIKFRDLAIVDYGTCWQSMREFVERSWTHPHEASEEIWFLEHHPVYTLGQAGKREHILHPHDIPIVSSDRGGQVTYHGPGQLVVYFLLNLKKRKLGVKDLVSNIEQTIIEIVKSLGINAVRLEGAPGVYVEKRKLASLGLRIRQGWSYHGLSLNVDMDLTPFEFINPCGIKNLKMTQLKNFIPSITMEHVKLLVKNTLLEIIL